MNTYRTLDPSRICDRKTLCAVSRKCRYHARRCEIARLRVLHLLGMQSSSVPAIWWSLKPARSKQLAERAASRLRAIAMRHYELYTQAANEFMGVNG